MRQSIFWIAAVTATVIASPSDVQRTAPPPLSAVSFMTGCWTGPSQNGAIIEEHYSEAADNMLIGMTRYVKAGRVIDFEFTTIERTDTSLVMTPRPKGVKSDSFPLKEVTDGYAVWENLKHDFPQRVIYRRGADGTLRRAHRGNDSAGRAAHRLDDAPVRRSLGWVR